MTKKQNTEAKNQDSRLQIEELAVNAETLQDLSDEAQAGIVGGAVPHTKSVETGCRNIRGGATGLTRDPGLATC